MLSRSWPKLIAASLALILCVAVVEAWRADRRDRAQLASELAATKQLLAAADARQRARDAQLAKTLSALDAQKRAIVTPEQIVRHLSKNIPLPAPVTLQSGQASSAGRVPTRPRQVRRHRSRRSQARLLRTLALRQSWVAACKSTPAPPLRLLKSPLSTAPSSPAPI